MIYETALVLRTDIDDATANTTKSIVAEVLKEKNGEVLVNDDWGVKSFPQTLGNNHKKGHYVYFMYKTNDNTVNSELERRLRINENVIRSLIVKLGDDKQQDAIVKRYVTPRF